MAAPLATVFGILINLIYFIPFSRKALQKSGELPADA
jgi:hypothetical protein